MKSLEQLNLFSAVEEAYLNNSGQLTQSQLYEHVSNELGVNPNDYYGVVGKNSVKCNLFYRKVRWVQQSLKCGQLLENVSKGVWRLVGKAKEKLEVIEEGKSVIAMSTALGIVINSETQSVLSKDIIPEKSVHLVVTSPPFLLQNARDYGGPTVQQDWLDFMMSVFEPIRSRMVEGGSLFINIGQDSFIPRKPARTTHLERFIIAMEDAGYYLVDRIILRSNKAPSPYAWTSLHRYMLKSSYDFCFHFTTDPKQLFTNNQEILLPHTEEHTRFVLNGGVPSDYKGSSDGAYSKRTGDYGKSGLSKGRLPDNSPYFANRCTHNELVNKYARENGLATHGAKMPYKIAKWLIQYGSRVGNLVFDPFYGSGTTCEAAEELGRRWIGCEYIKQFIQQSFVRYRTLTDEIWVNPAFALD